VQRTQLDLLRFLRQTVKSQNSANGELTHGIVSTKVHKRIETGRPTKVGRGASIAEVAQAFEVNPNLLHRWRKQFREGPGNVFPGFGKRRWDEGKVAQLERNVGQQVLEIDF
jgi:transposase